MCTNPIKNNVQAITRKPDRADPGIIFCRLHLTNARFASSIFCHYEYRRMVVLTYKGKRPALGHAAGIPMLRIATQGA